MNITQAQKDMSHAYIGGGAGVLVSGLVWATASFISITNSQNISMLTLFFGGMFIHPLGMLVAKLFRRSAKHKTNNPLGKLALENTFILFVGLFIAFSVAKIEISWFFSIMLMTIGVRYLSFSSLYGNKIYWLLGALLMISGMLCVVYNAPFSLAAFIGAGVELVFGFVILVQCKNEIKTI